MRIQENLVAKTERRLLDWMCLRMPDGVMPDHLTAIGVLGAVVCFAGFALCRLDSAFLWVSVAGIVINWFGDSLDGSLARFRKTERPRYGYFIDHSLDALCNSIAMIGLGTTGLVRMDVALFALNGYLLLSVFVFLRHKVDNVFQLTFLKLGPTEVRLIMIVLIITMFVFDQDKAFLSSWPVSAFDIFLGTVSVMFYVLFVVNIISYGATLAHAERVAPPAAAPAPTAAPVPAERVAAERASMVSGRVVPSTGQRWAPGTQSTSPEPRPFT